MRILDSQLIQLQLDVRLVYSSNRAQPHCPKTTTIAGIQGHKQ